MEETEVDLYADDEDFGRQDNEFGDADLYDELLLKRETRAPSVGSSKHSSQNGSHTNNESSTVPVLGVSKSNSNSNSKSSSEHRNDSSSGTGGGGGRKYSVFIGGLTWWTTDEDIMKILESIGIDDVHEIKFFDNRANGQSKGFCSASFLSDASAKLAIEKLGEMVLHGQNIAVTTCNRQNLQNFEMKSRKPGEVPNGSNSGRQPSNNPSSNNSNSNGPTYNQNNNRMNSSTMSSNSQRPPLIRPPTLRPGVPLLAPPRHPIIPNQNMLGNNWSGMMGGSNSRSNMNAGNPMLRTNSNSRIGGPQAPLLSTPGIPSSFGTLSLSGDPTNGFQTAGRFALNSFGTGPSNPIELGLSDVEHDSLVEKNKNMANSAISSALTDMSAGDFKSAVDTLNTAISLIKQSRVANDERCMMVIASLKDTLQSIESKKVTDYDVRREHRHRDRSRSYERSTSSRRERPRRSRSREYRDHSRDRDRYEDRDRDRERAYRERDRDRERDRERDRDRDRERERDRDRDRPRDRDRDHRRH